MIYPYEVKFNGEYYEAGEEVPEEATEENGTYSEKYTKTEINKMSIAELKNLATSVSIADADKKTGSELKKMLIEFYGL